MSFSRASYIGVAFASRQERGFKAALFLYVHIYIYLSLSSYLPLLLVIALLLALLLSLPLSVVLSLDACCDGGAPKFSEVPQFDKLTVSLPKKLLFDKNVKLLSYENSRGPSIQRESTCKTPKLDETPTILG